MWAMQMVGTVREKQTGSGSRPQTRFRGWPMAHPMLDTGLRHRKTLAFIQLPNQHVLPTAPQSHVSQDCDILEKRLFGG